VKKVLFLCTGNSCRSQMAEGFARAMETPAIEVYSAGVEARGLSPRAVAVMDEVGVDIRQQTSKTIAEIPAGEIDTVITLCGDAAARCPVFPGVVVREHWALADPARAEGSEEAILEAFRSVRDELQKRVRSPFGPG
jgi:arsenate reductase